jgi:hypothetical protein
VPYSSDVKWMSFDPGGTTGVCIYRKGIDTVVTVPTLSRGTAWETLQIGPDPHHAELWELLTSHDPGIVVCESFLNQQNNAALLVSLEYIGVIKLYCRLTGKHLVLQNPSQAKQFWVDEKLEWLGLYRPGQKHGMDALRHMLQFITFNKKEAKYVRLLRVHTNTAAALDEGLPGEAPLQPDVVDLPSSKCANE